MKSFTRHKQSASAGFSRTESTHMPAVKMFITKFGREVLIDDEHPLAVAEREAACEQVRGHHEGDEGRGARAAQTSQKRKQGR